MNKYGFCYILALCLTITLGGCDIEELMNSLNGEEEEMVEPPYFKDGSSYVTIKTNAPASGSFTVETNRSWVITEKPAWCELDVMEGTGETVVNVSIQTSTANQRIGYIKVFCADLQKEKIVEVKQNGNTLSVSTGQYKGSVVTYGTFKGTNNRMYKYEHKIKVEFTINGSHLASECGVTGSAFKGITSDGTHEATVTLLSDYASASFTYQAFATNKATGVKVYGKEVDIVSRQ